MKSNVFDVASYVLEQGGSLSGSKLHKILYYIQLWSLVWTSNPMFEEKIIAKTYGPCIEEIYNLHNGVFKVVESMCNGDSSKLDKDQKDIINQVITYYLGYNIQQLMDCIRREGPWDMAIRQRDNNEITPEAMLKFFNLGTGGMSK